jgi:hypothetical protein
MIKLSLQTDSLCELDGEVRSRWCCQQIRPDLPFCNLSLCWVKLPMTKLPIEYSLPPSNKKVLKWCFAQPILNPGTKWRPMFSLKSRPPYPHGKHYGTHRTNGWLAIQPGLDAVARRKILPHIWYKHTECNRTDDKSKWFILQTCQAVSM